MIKIQYQRIKIATTPIIEVYENNFLNTILNFIKEFYNFKEEN